MDRGRIVRYATRSFFFPTLVFFLSLTHPLTAQGDPEPPWNPVPVSVPVMTYQPPRDADDWDDFLPPGYVYINATTIPTPTITPTGTTALPTATVATLGGSLPAPSSIAPILPTETISLTVTPTTPPVTPTVTTTSTPATPSPTIPITTVVAIPATGAGAIFYEQQVALIVEDATFGQTTNIAFTPQETGPVTATNSISSPLGTTTLIQFQIEAINPTTSLPYEAFEHPVRLIVDMRPQLAHLITTGQLPANSYSYWLAYRDESNPDLWHEVPIIAHQGDGLISAEVTHFSEWAVGVRPERWNLQWNPPSVSEFSGAATFNYPIAVPPGRNGLQPTLALSYSSRGIDGLIHDPESRTIADGWSLAEISIIRIGVGYEEASGSMYVKHPNHYRLLLNGTGHELISHDSNQGSGTAVRFYARNAPNLRITRYYDPVPANIPNHDNLYWVVETPDGTRYRLGYTADAEEWQETNDANPRIIFGTNAHPGLNSVIDNVDYRESSAIAWHVDTITDANGNQMQYHYNQKEITEEIEHHSANHLHLITHKRRIVSIRYNYEDRIEDQDLPALPEVERLTGSYATEIEFHAIGDDLPQNATDPISRILIYHGSFSAPIKEYRIVTRGETTSSSGCADDWNNNRLTTTMVVDEIRLFVNTDDDPHTDAEKVAYALPPVTFEYTTKPHFYDATPPSQPCFSFAYLDKVNNGYGGETTFTYDTDNRSVGEYMTPNESCSGNPPICTLPPLTYRFPDMGYNYFVTKIEHFDGWQTYRTDYSYYKPCYQQSVTPVGGTGGMLDAFVCNSFQGQYLPAYGNILGFEETTITQKNFTEDTILQRIVTFEQDDDMVGMVDLEQIKNSAGQLLQETDHVLSYYNVENLPNKPERFAYIYQSYQYQYQPGDTNSYLASVVTNYYETEDGKQGTTTGEFFGHLTRRDYAYRQGNDWTQYRHDTFRYRVRQDNDYWLLLPWRSDVYKHISATEWLRYQLNLTYYDDATTNPDSATLTKGQPTLTRSLMIDDPISSSRWYTIDTQYGYDEFGNQEEIIVNPDYGQVWHEVDGSGNPTDYWKYTQLPGSSTEQKTTISYESTYNLYPISVTQEGETGAGDDLTTTFQIYGFNGVALDAWQEQTGLLKQVTNPTGLVSIYEYDPFGRLVATYEDSTDRGNVAQYLDGDPLVRYRYWDNGWNQATLQGGELIPIVYLDPANDDPFMITTQTRPGSFNATTPGYEFRTQTFFDGMGRVIQEHNTYQEVHDPDASSHEEQDIVTGTIYNAQGLAVCQTVPYAVELYNDRATFPENPFVIDDCTTVDHTATEYDELGRPKKITSPGGKESIYAYGITTNLTSYGHDRLAITRLQDANDHVVRQYQNALGQLVLVREYTDEEPNEDAYADTRYQYDILGNLIEVGTSTPTSSQPSSWLRLSEMTYDAFGRKMTMDDPDMGDWSYRYDALGNLTSQTDALGETLCFWVDPFNRPEVKRHDEDANGCDAEDTLLSQTSYYAAGSGADTGQVEEVLWPDSNNKETFAYDDKGLLASHTRWIAGTSYTMEYDDYDELNRPETLTYPSNESVAITYDHEGEKSITAGGTTLVSDIWYNRLGQMTELFRGNNVRTTYDYAGASGDFRLENAFIRRFVFPVTNPLLDFDYTYDDVGNITHIFEDVSNDSQWFGYDELNRLTTAYTTGGPAAYNHTYSYDQLGNLQSRTESAGSSTTYDMVYPTGNNPSQPHAVDEVKIPGQGGNPDTPVYTLSYDDNGNMVERQDHGAGETYTQEFDVENRLTSVTLRFGTPITTTFAYDAGGQRHTTISYDSSTERTVTHYPFSTYEVAYEQEWQAVSCGFAGCTYDWVTTQTTTRSIYFMAGQAIATRVNGTLYHLHSDHLGSTSLMTNSSGGSVSNTTARYLPYGGYRTTPTAGLTERGYTGHHENRDIGLTYMNARFYVPSLGRFLTADTIVPVPNNPQSFNRYTYVDNNPILFIDPTGHNRDCGMNDSYCNGLTPPEPLPSSIVTIELTLQQGNNFLSVTIVGTAVETNAILTHNHVLPTGWSIQDATNIKVLDNQGTPLLEGGPSDFAYVTGHQLGDMGDGLSLFVFREDFTAFENTASLAVLPSDATNVLQAAAINSPAGLYPTSVTRIYTENIRRGNENVSVPSIEVSPDRTVSGDSGMPLYYDGRVVGVNNYSVPGENQGRYGAVTDIGTIRWVIENKTRALQTSLTPGQR